MSEEPLSDLGTLDKPKYGNIMSLKKRRQNLVLNSPDTSKSKVLKTTMDKSMIDLIDIDEEAIDEILNGREEEKVANVERGFGKLASEETEIRGGEKQVEIMRSKAQLPSSSEDLSDLEGFVHLDKLLEAGGDIAKRAEFIINQFGKTSNTTVKRTPPSQSRGVAIPTKVPGLHPTRVSAPRGGGRSNTYFPRRKT